MKLIVFFKNKKELIIRDGSLFLRQWYKGCKSIVIAKSRTKLTIVSRSEIKDFIQARYYKLFKQAISPMKYSY